MKREILTRAFNVSMVLGSLALLLSSLSLTETPKSAIVWMNLDEVQHAVKEQPRSVFVDVYTSWCGPCKLMDRTTFRDAKVTEYVNRHYYAVRLNAESGRMVNFKDQQISEKELARSFRVQGYPTIIIMDENLEMVRTQLGYLKPAQFHKLLAEYSQANQADQF